jgi:hypothetical protein
MSGPARYATTGEVARGTLAIFGASAALGGLVAGIVELIAWVLG